MRRLLLLISLASLVFASGCAEAVAVKVSRSSRSSFAAFAGGGGGGPENRFLRVQSKKKTKPGQMAMRVPCDMWGPFRWEVSGGLYDPNKAAAADQAIFGTELDGRGPFPPTEFYGISSQVTNGGMNVFAFTHNSPTAIGSNFFAGATEIDFAIEATPTQLVFEARPTGGGGFTQIATFPFTNQATPLLPSIGAFNLSGKGVIGFDDWRLVSNGTEPGTPPAGHVAAREIWDVACAISDAGHAVDGIADFGAAATQLATAKTLLDQARATADALPTNKNVKKARKDLKTANKKLDSAITWVDQQKKVGKTIDALQAAAAKLSKASDRVYEVVALP